MLIVMRILGGGAAASVQAVGAGTIAVRVSDFISRFLSYVLRHDLGVRTS